ncbi:MAG: acyl-CoA thioesterase [Lentisphaerae bacterium]|jgi:acyl-CoA hydrolase|nr:acyl-CoA thioesterase [Lentisphaerota bacterium]
MQFNTLVRSEHLNHNGKLFGGYMLLWVDEYAYIAAITEYPGARFVTRAMDTVSFTQGVGLGAVLTFEVKPSKVGNTSVTYSVDVTATELPSGNQHKVFSTCVTLCNTDENGNKKELPSRAASN